MAKNRALQGDKSLLEIALDLHMGTTGSMECPPDYLEKCAVIIRSALASWEKGLTSTFHFDNAVRNLIETALWDHENA